MAKKRSVTFVGARGIGNYGGFETFVKEVAPLLHQRGIDVHCTCEKDGKNVGSIYLGAHLEYFPIPPPVKYSARKIFEFVYDIYFLFSSVSYTDEIVLLGTLGAPAVCFPRLMGKRVYVNIDGMEWRRDKFSRLEKSLLKMTFKMCLAFADKIIIDSPKLFDEIPEDARNKVVHIAYGVHPQHRIVESPEMRSKLKEHGIVEGEYWLVIARLEPENNIHMIVEAFVKARSKHRLVIVGKFTNPDYERTVQNLVNGAIFLGHVYDQEFLAYLRQRCFAYIHGHSVGGTNPSLLEAMASEVVIAAHDNGFNRAVMEGNGLYFGSTEKLSEVIEEVEREPEKFKPMAVRAKDRVIQHYAWSNIVSAYERLAEG